MNYVVDKVKEEQKEDVSILTHPHGGGATLLWARNVGGKALLHLCVL